MEIKIRCFINFGGPQDDLYF